MRDDNPALKYFDPYRGYNESAKGRVNEVNESTELTRLCYEVFITTKDGRRLFELLEQTHVLPGKVHPSDPHAAQLTLYWEGYKEAIRALMGQAIQHENRIKAYDRSRTDV